VDSETSPDAREDHDTAHRSHDDDTHARSTAMHRDQTEVNDSKSVKKSSAQYYPAPPESHTCSRGTFCNRQGAPPQSEEIYSHGKIQQVGHNNPDCLRTSSSEPPCDPNEYSPNKQKGKTIASYERQPTTKLNGAAFRIHTPPRGHSSLWLAKYRHYTQNAH